MTYDDYISDQKRLGKRIYYTRAAYNYKFYPQARMKRGRTNGGAKPPFKKRKVFRKGYDRTGGNYGRYKGANAELKFLDVNVDDSVVAVNGVIQTLGTIVTIPQGTGESQRIGRKVTIRKIGWKWRIGLAIVAGATINVNEAFRLIMYQDTQCNGATAAVTNILENDNYQSFRNLTETGRFKILFDKMFDLNAMAGAGDGAVNDTAPVGLSGEWYKDCNIPLEYSGTDGTIDELRSNNIAIMTVTKSGDNTVFNSVVRLRYSDQ